MLTAVIGIQSAAAVIGLITIYVIAIQKPSFYQKILLLTIICGFIGLISYMFEMCSVCKPEAFLAARFGYIGKSYVMALFLIFITRYCDIRVPKWIINAMLFICTAMLIVVITSPYHKLYYSSVDFAKDAPVPHLVLGKGVLYYIFIGMTIVIMLISVGLVIHKYIRYKGVERNRVLILCMAGLAPVCGLIINFTPFLDGVDLTPLGIMLSCMLISLDITKYGLLDIMQIAGENAMDYTGEGLIVVTKNMNFVYANKRAYEIFPELLGNSDNYRLIGELFGTVDADYSEKRPYRRNGRIYELHYSRLSNADMKGGDDASVSGYMAWIFDKTDEYYKNEELVRLSDEACAANKAKTMFLANMSHEIRTPMNGILGFADLALEHNTDKETEEYLRYIKSSAESLLDIINDVLDISKIESGKMELVNIPYNPTALFERVLELMKPQAETKGLKFTAFFPDKLPETLIGDKLRIKEIFINILANAIKYTPSGGVTVTVAMEGADSDMIWLEIKVSDTGVGIKKEKLDSIFDIFEQADNAGNYHVEGTGLGLSIAKRFAVMMGGDITVSSIYGEGSDFLVRIPQQICRENAADYEYCSGGENIRLRANEACALIADDNLINLNVEKRILERFGIKADTAESGARCVAAAEDKRYDVILMDHMMPGMDGVETLKRIREGGGLNRSTPILLVTANAIVGVRQEMLDAGFDGYVSKPIDLIKLERELIRVLPKDKTEMVNIGRSEKVKIHSGDFFDLLREKGVDVDMGIKYCGSAESYREVLDIIAETSEEKLKKITECLDKGDMANYTILIHSIKSGAANIGAAGLKNMALELEKAARNNDIEYVSANTASFAKPYTEILEIIKKGVV